MASPDPQHLAETVEQRRLVASEIDRWQFHKDGYFDWQRRIQMIDKIARGDWHMVWPDSKAERQYPRIPNYVDLALRHRARLIAEQMPTISIRPGKISEKEAAEKRERIVMGYWRKNHINGYRMQQWGCDLMLTGLAAVRVMPDFGESELEHRFPKYTRFNPRTLYPSPIYATGPNIDDVVYSEERDIREVERRYGKSLAPMMARAKNFGQAHNSRVAIYHYYDKERVMVVAEPLYSNGRVKDSFEVLVDEAHDLGMCPVVIGTRPSHDGAYRGDFDHMVAMLNVGNNLMNLHLDAAARKVYATLVVDEEVEDPGDEGPGAIITVKNNTGRVGDHIDFLNHPAASYDNYQVMRTLDSAIRTAALLPPSVTGDPNESVVSAAGISATQSMPNTEVVSLQRDSIGPMLEAANEVAMRCDEKHGDTKKSISGVQRGTSYVETYTPSKDIGGNYQNDVIYGMGAGLDKVNTGIMIKQDLGAGLISRQEARELNPFVEDPVRTEKLIRTENLSDAAYAGILAATQLPPGTPGAIDLPTLALLWEDLEKEDISLREALSRHAERMALVQPPPSPSDQTVPGRPGTAGQIGGQEAPQAPPQMTGAPPLEQLLAGG